MDGFSATKCILAGFVALAIGMMPLILVDGFTHPESSMVAAATTSDTTRYGRWQAALTRFVDNDGLVNYKTWKANREDLDEFVLSLEKISRSEYDSMSRNEKVALWINAYNAFTVQLVLDHYPLHRSGFNLYPESSIRQINGVWDKYKVLIAGKRLSLHEIENEILRKEFKEPLIHFAINCASQSCPPLSNKAYLGTVLQHQLKGAALRFIRATKFNRVDPVHRKVALSKIFEWYGPDFVPGFFVKPLAKRSRIETAVIRFVAEYSNPAERTLLESNEFSLSYLNYDWTLNESSGKQ